MSPHPGSESPPSLSDILTPAVTELTFYARARARARASDVCWGLNIGKCCSSFETDSTPLPAAKVTLA